MGNEEEPHLIFANSNGLGPGNPPDPGSGIADGLDGANQSQLED